MKNDKSNTRGSEIRRVVIFMLLAGFCVAIFAQSAAATQWDPSKALPHIDQIVIRPEYDEGGWGETQSSPVDIWFFLKSSIYSPNLYWLFDILPDLDRGDDVVTNSNDQNNDPDADPHRTTYSE